MKGLKSEIESNHNIVKNQVDVSFENIDTLEDTGVTRQPPTITLSTVAHERALTNGTVQSLPEQVRSTLNGHYVKIKALNNRIGVKEELVHRYMFNDSSDMGLAMSAETNFLNQAFAVLEYDEIKEISDDSSSRMGQIMAKSGDDREYRITFKEVEEVVNRELEKQSTLLRLLFG